jgi:uncharacterized NAD(P)/FAD-binding protein YdhS
MLKNDSFNFAIIGGGLTATAMLTQLTAMLEERSAERQLDPSRMTIRIFHRGAVFGPGYPHNENIVLPFHITNMCASEMGIIAGDPGDFQAWVSDHYDYFRKRFPWFRERYSDTHSHKAGCQHYPRAIMGQYLKDRFQHAVDSGRKLGVKIHLHPRSEVLDLKQDNDTVRLRIEDLDSKANFSIAADRVLLATGHWNQTNAGDQYFTSPWPAKMLLSSIPEGEKVAVIGTSLSAIETVLTLTSEGEFIRLRTGELVYKPPANPRRFALYSRRGLLPKVRGKMGKRQNKFLHRETIDRLLSEDREHLTLDVIFNLLNSELEDAYGHGIDWKEILNPTDEPPALLQRCLDDAIHGDGPDGELIWQTVLHQTFDLVRDVYLNLTFGERKRFDRHYSSVFFTHAAVQPAVNAEKLLALMTLGLVEVIKLGESYRLIKKEDPTCYELTYSDIRGVERKDVYGYVVNARGQNKSLHTDPSVLAKNLHRSSTILTTEIRWTEGTGPLKTKAVPGSNSTVQAYQTGSIWIDPGTHRIMTMGSDNSVTPSNAIYAVGAMTRGQIVDASMARSIVQSTSRVARDIVACLIRNH